MYVCTSLLGHVLHNTTLLEIFLTVLLEQLVVFTTPSLTLPPLTSALLLLQPADTSSNPNFTTDEHYRTHATPTVTGVHVHVRVQALALQSELL